MLRITLAVAVIVCATPWPADANEVAQAEQQVQREFRFFRIQVFNTFRASRPVYDGRRQAGEEALAAWRQAGGQPHQAEPLVAWYRDAKAASLPGVTMPLPPLPEFPEAIVATPQPAADDLAVSNAPSPQPSSLPAKEETKIYRVRQVATRSTSTPYSLTPNKLATGPADQPGKQMPQPVWQSISRALFKGMSLSGAPGDAGN